MGILSRCGYFLDCAGGGFVLVGILRGYGGYMWVVWMGCDMCNDRLMVVLITDGYTSISTQIDDKMTQLTFRNLSKWLQKLPKLVEILNLILIKFITLKVCFRVIITYNNNDNPLTTFNTVLYTTIINNPNHHPPKHTQTHPNTTQFTKTHKLFNHILDM